MTPNDPDLFLQTYLNLIGDIQTVWDDYNGSGVKVAVYEDGVDINHADLAGNWMDVPFTFDGTTYDPNPNSSIDAIGTAVAGIIAAQGNNSVGIAGVAWNADLSAVDFSEVWSDISAGGGLDTPLLNAVIQHMQNFDVVNFRSDMSAPIYATSQNPNSGSRISETSVILAGFESVAANGRSGLGTTIVQGTGDEDMNANGAGLYASRYTTSVAATQLSGTIADYSNFGTSILISAPASSRTTDITGAPGYVPGDYVGGYNGTSAAAPVVSGVIALMLEAESGLGWRDVQNILATSASHTGTAFGGGTATEEYGAWMANGAGNWNGGGMTYHLSYGFGMVDAHAAVRMAEAWFKFFDNAKTSTNEVSETHQYTGGAIAIPTDSTFDQQFTIDVPIGQNILIENITVEIDLAHTWGYDLTLTLIAPDGTEFEIFTDQYSSGLSNIDNPPTSIDFLWEFGITGARGMQSAGEWALRVEDSFGADGGSIDAWNVTFHGSQTSMNDVHHFTDDYLDYLAQDASRGMLSDTNGGEDWLNFTALTDDLVLQMAQGLVSTIGGVNAMTIASGTDIENVYAGDGNDQLFGNALNNEMHGGRGNDTINGDAGSDLLNGGEGDDTISGGNEDDTLGGSAGSDTLDGGEGHDWLWGGAQADTLGGGNGNDVLNGQSGADWLYGGEGDNTFNGGNGADRLFAFGNGINQLGGDAGEDILVSGYNYDHMWGGTEADNFQLGWWSWHDFIYDFEDGVDKIDLSEGYWYGSQWWYSTTSQMNIVDDAAGNAFISLGQNTWITIYGVSAAQIDDSDFVF